MDAEGAIVEIPSTLTQICEEVYDVLKIYYHVVRVRFTDGIYQQVVDHYLLNGDESPLRIFGPERVLLMTAEQLRMIAEEDSASRRTREKLEREIVSLEKAMVVLRS